MEVKKNFKINVDTSGLCQALIKWILNGTPYNIKDCVDLAEAQQTPDIDAYDCAMKVIER